VPKKLGFELNPENKAVAESFESLAPMQTEFSPEMGQEIKKIVER